MSFGDLACGSGTLLTAAYGSLMGLESAIKLYHNLGINLDDIGKALIEDGVYGIDALRHASQITTINLALIGPQKITRDFMCYPAINGEVSPCVL